MPTMSAFRMDNEQVIVANTGKTQQSFNMRMFVLLVIVAEVSEPVRMLLLQQICSSTVMIAGVTIPA
jgi:hypothetical protein